jgi:hypothetical protein
MAYDQGFPKLTIRPDLYAVAGIPEAETNPLNSTAFAALNGFEVSLHPPIVIP